MGDPPVEPLPENAVHVWLSRADEGGPQHDEALAVLSADERIRSERFQFPDLRRLYVVAHALVRRTLSRYAPVDPGDWMFELEGQGKPRIRGPAEYGWLQFNLSHTSGLAACGVSRRVPVGVDVEHLSRRQRTRTGDPQDCLPLARYCLAEREYARLPELDHAERWLQFLRFWTLKESYLKACATGISQPLQEFAFSWTAAGPQVEFLSAQDDPARWFFAEHRPTDLHVAAVAVQGEGPREVLWRELAW